MHSLFTQASKHVDINIRMDMNLFRKHLAKHSKLTESIVGRNLAHEISTLHRLRDLKKMIQVVANVQAEVKERGEHDSMNFRHYKKLDYNLQELLDLLDSGRPDPSEVEILQKQIATDLKRL